MMNKFYLTASMFCLALAANAQNTSTPKQVEKKPVKNAVNDAYKRAVKEAQTNGTQLPEKPKKPSKPRPDVKKPGT